jgi:hypothetical protein
VIRKALRALAWIIGSFSVFSGLVGLPEFGPRSLLVSVVGLLIIPGPWDVLKRWTGVGVGWGWRAAGCLGVIMLMGVLGG